MLPNIRNGSSFTGAGLYYLHDKRQEGETIRLTDQRVAWTHTVNCVADDPYLALNEMMATVAQQGYLKREAGLGPGGPKSSETVKTISLSWHPEENPDQQTMVAVAENYLRHRGWQEHQALLIAHNDTPHPHVHILLNKIHPETGRVLDDFQDQPRSQEWAYEFEKEQGRIRCEARIAKYEQGEPTAVPREVWESWQELSGDLRAQQHIQERQDASEWDILKQHQRDERDGYRAETTALIREARAAAYREVRDEFRDEWREFYDAKKAGADPEQLTAMRADILDRQKEQVATRQQEAIAELRDNRAVDYQAMLAEHRGERRELREDQAAGVTRYDLLNLANPPASVQWQVPVEGNSVDVLSMQMAQLAEAVLPGDTKPAPVSLFEQAAPDTGLGLFAKKDPLTGLAGGLLGLVDRFADSLTGSVPAPPPAGNRFAAMAEQREAAQVVAAHQERLREEAREAVAREAYWEERSRERSYDRER